MKGRVITFIVLSLVPHITRADVGMPYDLYPRCGDLSQQFLSWASSWPVLLLEKAGIQLGDAGILFFVYLFFNILIVLGTPYFIGRYFDKKAGRLSMSKFPGRRFGFLILYILLSVLIGAFLYSYKCGLVSLLNRF